MPEVIDLTMCMVEVEVALWIVHRVTDGHLETIDRMSKRLTVDGSDVVVHNPSPSTNGKEDGRLSCGFPNNSHVRYLAMYSEAEWNIKRVGLITAGREGAPVLFPRLRQ